MINIIDKKDCCGCRACEVRCPVNCIKMKADNEGFWYPEIMIQECVRCGMCEKVCPILNKTSKTGKTETLGILAKDDNIRKNSSSGGVFSLIAQHILEQGGIVFGASFDENMMVHHIGVESSEGLEKLRGSKYLQSNTENTYTEAQEELKKGRLVLYSGTACQIEALKNVLGREYENLITIDILCHGVPSPKLWKKYLDYQEKQAGGQTGMVLALVFLFVFLFLAALYESWSVPVAVLLSLPIAALGAYIGIIMCGLENDTYFQIGLVMLMGLAAKNAILIVEFAKDEADSGVNLFKAALHAARLRFRPILMTSFAFILGILPMVIASGPGAASRRAIGTGVFFGMIAAVTIGILLIPFFFITIYRGKIRSRKENKPKALQHKQTL